MVVHYCLLPFIFIQNMFIGTLKRGTILVLFKNTFKDRLKNIFKGMAIFGVVFSTTVLYANTYDGVKYDNKQIECLSTNAYHEARNQGDKGIIATVFVVLNRTKDSRFPSTPCAVVKQKGQFSWVGKGKVIKDKETYQEVKQLVLETVKGEHRDFTHGSTYYHATYVKPSWSNKMKCTVRIKDHVFYKPINREKQL